MSKHRPPDMPIGKPTQYSVLVQGEVKSEAIMVQEKLLNRIQPLSYECYGHFKWHRAREVTPYQPKNAEEQRSHGYAVSLMPEYKIKVHSTVTSSSCKQINTYEE